MLHKLPREILLLILDQVPHRRDLKQLCEVSKTLYAYTMPKLYETISIRAKNEWHLERAEVEPFLITSSSPTDRLSHVKMVEVQSRFQDVLVDRCPHFKDMENFLGSLDFETQSIFDELATRLMPIFRRLKEESLRGFSWEMGTCVPFQILGNQGYMNKKQRSIKTLSLITGGECPINIDGLIAINLSAFRSLQEISWTGLHSPVEFDALCHALKNNSAHLRQLHLDFVQWPEEDWEGDEDEDLFVNFFASRVLRLSPDQSEIIFPALKNLSLSFISLVNAEKEIAKALNASGLSSLTLRHCDGIEEFLSAIIDTGQGIKLSSLEVAYGPSDNVFDIYKTLPTFLTAFQGLKDLFISLAGPDQTLDIWRTLAHHKSSLSRFVCHQRAIEIDDDLSDFENEMDLLDLSLLPAEVAELDQSESEHPFAALNLEFVGLSCLRSLESILAPFTKTKTLKILHIRKSGPEMRGPMEASSGHLIWNRDTDTDDDSSADDDSKGSLDPDEVIASNLISEDRPSRESASNDGESPRSTDSTTSSESFDTNGQLLWFTNWAFGPNGFPALQVLAFGDFSHGGRFKDHNLLFCRHKCPVRKPGNDISQQGEGEYVLNFRPLREDDRDLWDLIDRNIDALAACPTEPIVVA